MPPPLSLLPQLASLPEAHVGLDMLLLPLGHHKVVHHLPSMFSDKVAILVLIYAQKGVNTRQL